MGFNIAELMAAYEEDKTTASEGAAGGNYLENFVMMPKEEGVVTVRLLPPGPDNGLPLAKGGLFMPTRVHTICQTPQYPNGRKVHCRREKVPGKKYPVGDCRICDHYNWLYRKADECKDKGDKEGQESFVREARAIKPVERYYYNAIVRKVVKDNGDVENNVGPKILSIGKTLQDRIMKAICGNESTEEEPLGNVADLANGMDFKIHKKIRSSGDDKFPNYDESKFAGSSPAGNPDQIKKWMSELHDLAALRVVKTADEVERDLRIHLGQEKESRANTYDPSKLGGGNAGPSPAQVAMNSNVEVDDEGSSYTPAATTKPYTPDFDEFDSGSMATSTVVAPQAKPSEAMDHDTFLRTLKEIVPND
jgi:hypothetical protein